MVRVVVLANGALVVNLLVGLRVGRADGARRLLAVPQLLDQLLVLVLGCQLGLHLTRQLLQLLLPHLI
jgi:hypothetical protein